MKAKDKANELVDTYRMMLMNEDTECGQEILCTIIAKKSALIAVDAVLSMASHSATKQYWEQVKMEIQKI